MGDTLATSLHFLTIFLQLVTLGGYLGGLFGDAWWKNASTFTRITHTHGLLRNCDENSSWRRCQFREDIFRFHVFAVNEEIIPDILLILLITSTVFCLIGNLAVMSLFCCRTKRSLWRLGMLSCIYSSLLSLLLTLGGVIYEAVVDIKYHHRSWAAIVTWTALGTNLSAFVIDCVLICKPPQLQDGGMVNVNPHRSTSYTVETSETDGVTHKFYDEVVIEHLPPSYSQSCGYYDNEASQDFPRSQYNRARYASTSDIITNPNFIIAYHNNAYDK